jgi:hypothetical protein
MNKAVKIAIISLAVVVAAMGVLFVVIPLASSKEAEARLGEALAEAGIPDDMWSVDGVRYVPLLGHVVVEKLEFGERDGIFLQAKKVTLALDNSKKDFLAGSVDAQELSFSADDTSITAKGLSVNNFSVDKELFGYSPVEAVKKLGKIRLSDAVFRQRGRTYFSLGSLNADVNYAEGKIPLPSSISLKDLVMDVRQFISLPALRPEYKLSSLDLKNSISGGAYKINFATEGANLFALKVDLGISLPRELLASGRITNLAQIDYGEDAKINSLVLTYTDKSLLDHIFELAGMPGGRARAADQLNETLAMLAMTSGVDAERFVSEATKFIAKPGKFELKTNINSPVGFEEITRNPLATNLSLSINGGKPFITGKQ